MTDYRPFVDEVKSMIPGMVAAWRLQKREGYDARMAGKPRRTHHARRRGLWFRGWDEADKELREATKAAGGEE